MLNCYTLAIPSTSWDCRKSFPTENTKITVTETLPDLKNSQMEKCDRLFYAKKLSNDSVLFTLLKSLNSFDFVSVIIIIIYPFSPATLWNLKITYLCKYSAPGVLKRTKGQYITIPVQGMYH